MNPVFYFHKPIIAIDFLHCCSILMSIQCLSCLSIQYFILNYTSSCQNLIHRYNTAHHYTMLSYATLCYAMFVALFFPYNNSHSIACCCVFSLIVLSHRRLFSGQPCLLPTLLKTCLKIRHAVTENPPDVSWKSLLTQR